MFSLGNILRKIAILAYIAGQMQQGQARRFKEHIKGQPTIIEGDIAADKELLRMIQRGRTNRQKRVARKSYLRLWSNGLIPYVIAADVPDALRRAVRRAFKRLAAKTCIRFIPKQKTHNDYIHFIQGNGCYSSVGRQGGEQIISLGPTCHSRFRALHEVMHALGFLHEHSRPDRDKYVKILYWNIENDQEKNFVSYAHKDVDTLSEPYDFNSILHYDNKAFSKNGRDTIRSLKNPDMRFGHARYLSAGDVRQIRKLYKCDRRRAKQSGSYKQHFCIDKIAGCKRYAEKSDACESNYEFMNLFCQISCGFCGNG